MMPFQKGKRLEGIDINLSNSLQWIWGHMKRDNWIPDWWEEFCPLGCSPDRHHYDTKVKTLAHLQAAAFHMPSAQKEVHGYWSASPCLGVLGKREYLPLRDPGISQDYWKVQRGEILALAIVLHRCAICAEASQNMFCGAVQEFHDCIAPVVEQCSLFNMEMEILEKARKGLGAPSSLKKALSPMPGTEETTSAPAPIPPPTSEMEEAKSTEELALVPRRWPSPPPRFAPESTDDSEMWPLEDAYESVASPIGSILNLTTLALLEMTILHTSTTGEVHYWIQAWSITRISLLNASSQEQLEPSPRIGELWAVIMVS